MDKNKIKLTINKDYGVINKKDIEISQNTTSIIYAANGTGKTKQSRWLVEKLRNQPNNFYDTNKNKNLDISDNITLSGVGENNLNYFLVSTSSEINIGTLHYSNIPNHGISGDFMLINSMRKWPKSFREFLSLFVKGCDFPDDYVLPDKKGEEIANIGIKDMKELHSKIKALVFLIKHYKFKAKEIKLTYFNDFSEIDKKKHFWRKETWNINSSGYFTGGNFGPRGFDVIGKLADIFFTDGFKALDSKYGLGLTNKPFNINIKIIDIEFLKNVLNDLTYSMLIYNINNSENKYPKKWKQVKNRALNETLNKYFPKSNVPIYLVQSFWSFTIFSMKHLKIKWSKNILGDVAEINWRLDEIQEFYEESDIYKNFVAAFKSVDTKISDIETYYTMSSSGMNLNLKGTRYDFLSAGQKTALDIQLRKIAIDDHFSTWDKDREKYLIIDDVTETTDKVKTEIFLRTITNMHAYNNNLTIILFTHDFSILNLCKYMSFKNTDYFTLTQSKLIKHKPILMDKSNGLLKVMNEFTKKNINIGLTDLSYLLRFLSKNEILKEQYVTIGVEKYNINELNEEINSYCHSNHKIDMQVHVGLINWLISNIETLVSRASGDLQLSGKLKGRKNISKLFLDVANDRGKFEISSNKYINNYSQALKARMWAEKELGVDRIKNTVTKKLVDNNETAKAYEWLNIKSNINQLIHIESHDSLLYSSEATNDYSNKIKVFKSIVKMASKFGN